MEPKTVFLSYCTTVTHPLGFDHFFKPFPKIILEKEVRNANDVAVTAGTGDFIWGEVGVNVMTKVGKQKLEEGRRGCPSLSSDIITYLCMQGYSQKQIGDALGLSKTFISRVARQERSFTIEHLLKLEKKMGKPLPLLFLQAVSKEKLPAKIRPFYEKTLKLIEKAEEVNREFAE